LLRTHHAPHDFLTSRFIESVISLASIIYSKPDKPHLTLSDASLS
jgi:hypothetical protein